MDLAESQRKSREQNARTANMIANMRVMPPITEVSRPLANARPEKMLMESRGRSGWYGNQYMNHTLNLALMERNTRSTPIFTRELLREAAQTLEQARLLAASFQGKEGSIRLSTKNIWGEVVEYTAPIKNIPLIIKFARYFHIAQNPDVIPYMVLHDRDKDKTAIREPMPPLISEPAGRRPLDPPLPQQDCAAYESEWMSSPTRVKFEKALQIFQSSVRVKNIVCIGLGCPRPTSDNLGSCEQHIVVAHMARYLSKLYAEQDNAPEKVIPIIACDPFVYGEEEIALLSTFNPPIKVLEEPYHYLEINEHTLIVALYVPKTVPFLEITADLTLASGGPAAIFMNREEEAPGNREGFFGPWDAFRMPRVLKMLDSLERTDLKDVPTPTPKRMRALRWMENTSIWVRSETKKSVEAQV